ncbi:putative Cytochrome P450 2U1 [Hypsibius exemplaris]|uniref:Cytochrome P450 2U1 n=1 Tax=Hypsibius exemplaris TaxID=2072580 RepID=A0A1W0X6G7_HYPEX|nr:putative Cytochrome P450 2U1 [Hypsibius exemplaris]
MWFPNPVRAQIMSARNNLAKLNVFMSARIKEHKNADRRTDVEDYLHAYQTEKETGNKTDKAAQATFDETQLLASLFDLFAAGTETTSTTTLWAFVFMVEYPHIMRKVQEEIDSTVGREKMLTNSDRALLPYTEAVILEVQRCASLVPLGVPHRARDEITVDGYTIPKNAIIFANLFSIHRDPRWWKNPEKFDPERFLDENRKLTRPDGFAPFSIGKRACLGEALAKMELFLFIANLLRCFTLELPKGKTISHEDYISSVVNSPKPYELIFVPRY